MPSNESLIHVLKSQPGVTFSKNQNPALGAALTVVGYVLVGACVTSTVVVGILKGLDTSFQKLVVVFITIALASVAAACLLRWGRRLRAIGPIELLQKDSRAPVIYLRPFGADGRNYESPISGLGSVLGPVAGVDAIQFTEEETLALVMHDIGPFLAVGNPRDQIPFAGAARLYVTNEHWREVVGALTKSASIVILRAGETPGLMWEAEHLVKCVSPKCVLLFVPNPKEYATFRNNADSVMPHNLPTDLNECRFIRFASDWQPCLIHRHKGGFFTRGNRKNDLRLELASFLPELQGTSAGRSLDFRVAMWTLGAILAAMIGIGILGMLFGHKK